jgi:rhodanese-related sulfurtransferase
MPNAQAKPISSADAHKLLQDNPRAVLVDIRSTMEYLFVGHPTGSIHVAWIDEPDWTVNPHFVTDVRKVMLGGATSHDDISGAPVMLICRSGKRSIDAGKLLLEAGFSNVLFVDEGFEGELDEHRHRGSVGGWRFHGLPWEQC